MKAGGLIRACVIVLCILSLPALHLSVRFRDIHLQSITSTLSKILQGPLSPAFTLGDGGSKAFLPPPPGGGSMLGSGNDKSNIMLVTLIAAANQTIGAHYRDVTKSIKITPLHSMREWWKGQSKGRTGILVVLLPFLMTQLQIFATTAPLVLERLTQYLNPPLSILTSTALLRSMNGISYLQRALWVSMAMGTACMLYDTLTAGASWSPLLPAADSYAIVTGCDQMLGKELSRKLYCYGYNLVLIGDCAEELQSFKLRLQNATTDPIIPVIVQSPQRLVADLTKRLIGVSQLVSDRIDMVPELRQGIQQLTELQQRWTQRVASQPAVQQCVKHIQTQLNASVYPVIADLRYAVAERSQPLVQQLHRTVTTSNSNSNSSLQNVSKLCVSTGTTRSTYSKHTVIPRPHSRNAATVSASVPITPRVRDIQIIVSDWTDSSAAHTTFAELQQRQLNDKVEVLAHAADRQFIGPLQSVSASSLQQMLQCNVQSAVTFTHLLLPSMLKITRGPGLQRVSHPHRALSTAVSVLRRACSLTLKSPKNQVTSQSIEGTKEGSQMPVSVVSSDRRGGGRILFLSSLGSAGPSPSNIIYAASKAFLSSFAQSLRSELLPHGVLVTVAHCGAIYGNAQHHHSRLTNNDIGAVKGPLGGDAGEDRRLQDSDPSLAVLPESAPHVHPSPGVQWPIEDKMFAGISSSGDTNSEGVPAFIAAQSSVRWPQSKMDHTLPEFRVDPFIYKLPGGTLAAERVAEEIFTALRTGRDAITPGIWNKVYLHGVAKILPLPALAALQEMAWSPAPYWSSPALWELPTVHVPALIPTIQSIQSKLQLRVLLHRLPGIKEFDVGQASRNAAKSVLRVANWSLSALKRQAVRIIDNNDQYLH